MSAEAKPKWFTSLRSDPTRTDTVGGVPPKPYEQRARELEKLKADRAARREAMRKREQERKG